MTTAADQIAIALRAPYARILVREEDNGYSARVLEFDGCFSGGDTAEEAMTNLDDAIALWIESELESGHDIPVPLAAVEHSGRLSLRLPPSLHARAVEFSRLENVSLNRFISDAVSFHVGYEASNRWLTNSAMKWARLEIENAPKFRSSALTMPLLSSGKQRIISMMSPEAPAVIYRTSSTPTEDDWLTWSHSPNTTRETEAVSA